MLTETSNSLSTVERTLSAAGSKAAKKPIDPGEQFLRVFVVVVGISLGAVAALIVGVMTKLIAITC